MSWLLIRKRKVEEKERVCATKSLSEVEPVLTGPRQEYFRWHHDFAAFRVKSSSSSDRLRQPDNLPVQLGHQVLNFRETHGFASLPHGRFAFIVCNRCF